VPFHFDIPLEPMEARSVKSLPADTGAWLYEPKWDGFRCICLRDGDEVYLQSKAGQPLARYFPEIVAAARGLAPERFVIDGELVVPVDDALDFDELLQRIHPATSRVNRLARERPATYLVFDLLALDGALLAHDDLSVRRPALEEFAVAFTDPTIRLSTATQNRMMVERWYARVGGALDGVIAKRLDQPYLFGSRDAMQKVKRLRTADCVVGGFRTSADESSIGSLLLGLYDDEGSLTYVGFTSGFSAAEKATMLPRFAALKTAVSFTRNPPGGPSRWNRGKDTTWTPVYPDVVLEVEFDHVSGGRFRHGTRPLRFRPDKDPAQCTFEQLHQPKGTSPFTLAAATEE
jgi:ATP-dependent DNA ligase